MTRYAVYNTERDLFIKLGSYGPHLTNNLERAEKHAGGSHLQVVEIEMVEV